MNEKELEEKLTAAYDKMMARINTMLDTAEHQAIPALQENIDKAKQQAIELKELTIDEAEKVANYIRRDLHDIAEYLKQSGKEFSTWFDFDVELIEDRLFELFAKVADKTRLALTQLSAQAKLASEYRTGEITGIGTLKCINCGTLMHFKKTSRIPPCPKCHKTVFVRTRKNNVK